MSQELHERLSSTLIKLEKTYQKMKESQSYNKEIERIKLLQELVKEQVKNENTDRSTRTTR
jgi:hypothetical protein